MISSGSDTDIARRYSWSALFKYVVHRSFEMRLAGAVFLKLAKAFDTVSVEGLLYKLTSLHFISHTVKTLSSYLPYRTCQTSLNSATSTRRNTLAGMAQVGLVSLVMFSLYVNYMPKP